MGTKQARAEESSVEEASVNHGTLFYSNTPSSEVFDEETSSSEGSISEPKIKSHPSPFCKKNNIKLGFDENFVTNPKAGSPSKRLKLISSNKL